jgi:hypothetical protein
MQVHLTAVKQTRKLDTQVSRAEGEREKERKREREKERKKERERERREKAPAQLIPTMRMRLRRLRRGALTDFGPTTSPTTSCSDSGTQAPAVDDALTPTETHSGIEEEEEEKKIN